MSINESVIRRIIREESFRFLNEGEGLAGLKIIDFEWDDMHNDGGMRTQGGELTIMFYTEEMHKANIDNAEAKKYISSYLIPEDHLLEDLTTEINNVLEGMKLPTVDESEVREALGGDALGGDLKKIMGMLRESEKIYQDAADEADRYGGGGDFFESRRVWGQRLREGESFRIKSNIPPEILRDLKPGDRIPMKYLEPSSISGMEGHGARAASRLREPEIIGMKSLGDYKPSRDWEEEEGEEWEEEDELYEARKKGKSVVKKGGKKASAGSVAIFKKAAKAAKGGEAKKKRAGFDAVKKSAEKWADDPAAVAQAATMVAAGEPVVSKGEKRKLKKESVSSLREQLLQIIRES